MHARQMSSLVLAIVLAFPPGWCCTGGVVSGSEKSGSEKSGNSLDVANSGKSQAANMARSRSADVPMAACCRAKASRSQSGKAPRSAIRCCCFRDALRSQAGLQISTTVEMSLPITVEADQMAIHAISGNLTGEILFAGFGPPLHVLQCVWQC